MDKGFHTFSKGINLKGNIIVWLKFKPAHHDVAIQHVSHYVTGTFPHVYLCLNSSGRPSQWVSSVTFWLTAYFHSPSSTPLDRAEKMYHGQVILAHHTCPRFFAVFFFSLIKLNNIWIIFFLNLIFLSRNDRSPILVVGKLKLSSLIYISAQRFLANRWLKNSRPDQTR